MTTLKRMITSAALCMGTVVGAFAATNFEVKNVEAHQRYPWNGKVDIDFLIESSDADAAYKVTVVCTDHVGNTNLTLRTIKYNDKGEAEYHVYYESTISASYDMDAITFDIDEEAKTITPHLPEPEIGDPSIDTTALDYLPKKPNANLKDVISVCKADTLAEVTSAGGILYTANQNMRRTMEALLMPVTEKTGYSITWPDDESSRQDNAPDDQSEEQEEDDSYEED